jgi:predicted ribosomally synthesized peptide with nif11-like leader
MSNLISDFLSKVSADSALAGQYKDAKDLKDVSTLASSLGYKISPAELQEYFSNNLNDDDLDGISGGNSAVVKQTHGGWYSGD